ncbi:MAG TPA: zf-HC2 domain-containing protein [Acidimicrobiales bacterium]
MAGEGPHPTEGETSGENLPGFFRSFGNQWPGRDDYQGMDCAFYRLAISARIDGEDSGLESAAVDGHLAGCPACRDWAEAASRVTRAVRVAPADVVPDLTASILRALAARPAGEQGEPAGPVAAGHPPHLEPVGPVAARSSAGPPAAAAPSPVGVARLGLLMVGLAQLCLAIPALLGDDGGAPIHIAHEQGSWFLALAVGLLVVAWRPSRAPAILPLMAALVVGLVSTMALDISAGRTQAAAEAPHGLAILGLGFVWLLAYPATIAGRRSRPRARPA